MRGGDSAGLRAFNECQVIDAIRRMGPLSQAEIARATGLSGQAASMIVKRLLTAELVTKGQKVRGRVGQPSTPIGLNPAGAHSMGLKIGRRGIDGVMVDLLGNIVSQRTVAHDAPYPERTIETARQVAGDLLSQLDPSRRDRVIGAGIAIPWDIPAWSEELGLSPNDLGVWKEHDIQSELGDSLSLPVTVYNDALAACAAEVFMGGEIAEKTLIYIFLGAFVGAGIVIDGKIFAGAQSNAGAIASMPICSTSGSGKPEQLLHKASITRLERMLDNAGMGRTIPPDGELDDQAEAVFRAWLDDAGRNLARAIVSALAVIDFETVVLDGALPQKLQDRLRLRVTNEIKTFDLRGLPESKIVSGSMGSMARVLGAAMLPLQARFSPDPDIMLRSDSRDVSAAFIASR